MYSIKDMYIFYYPRSVVGRSVKESEMVDIINFI